MTVVTVHSAITRRPVPGATFDTATDNFHAVIAKALSFPEVRNADWADRMAGQDAIEQVFSGLYPFTGDIRDPRFAKYGISHISVTPSASESEQSAPEDTPIYSETIAATEGDLTPEARQFLSGLSSVKSTPADFKPVRKVGLLRKLWNFLTGK